MIFIRNDRRKPNERDIRQPGLYLFRDETESGWNFQTTFDLYSIVSKKTVRYIGKVKIGRKGLSLEKGRERQKTALGLSNGGVSQLSNDYFSLGQDVEFYENIIQFHPKNYRQVLGLLRDVVENPSILKENFYEASMSSSLLRDVSKVSIEGQFKRILEKQNKMISYNFGFRIANSNRELQFLVEPKGLPPSNIQVVIGKNGVGKSELLRKMIEEIIQPEKSFNDKSDKFLLGGKTLSDTFANAIGISFSAFDYSFPTSTKSGGIDYQYIGLKGLEKSNTHLDSVFTALEKWNYSHKKQKNIERIIEKLDTSSLEFESVNQSNYLRESLIKVLHNPNKLELWKKAIEILEHEPSFRNLEITDKLIIANRSEPKGTKVNTLNTINEHFVSRLSSGHKIVLLIVTKLVELTQEKSLIFIDEPENYLHPPMLSLLVRAISEILRIRNGVAIIATHSPVVLQEVPSNCTWIMDRKETSIHFERPVLETFGEDIGTLNREIFRLDTRELSYYSLIQEVVEKSSNIEEVFRKFDNKIGSEARSLARQLMYLKNVEGERWFID